MTQRARRLHSVSIAALRLGVCVRTVKRWIHRGCLPAMRTNGGHWRIAERDIRAREILSQDEQKVSKSRTNRDTPY